LGRPATATRLLRLAMFVMFVTLMLLFWMIVFCCTSVRGGRGAVPSKRAAYSERKSRTHPGLSKCAQR
jgi:hypothetical protein